MYRSNRLYCFSPPVMIATFVIEIGAACYILYRYRLSIAARLMTALLVMLGLFQTAEYMVCEGAWGLSSLDWARLGYVAITMLPPLGLHLGLTIAGRKNNWLLGAVYGSAISFAAFFLLIGHGISGSQCAGNYVIFQVAPGSVLPYTIYYYGWLMVSVSLMLRYANEAANKQRAAALHWLAGGYAAFIVPTTLANVIRPETIAGVPSVMCGFAVILAIIIVSKVAPLTLDAEAPITTKARPQLT